jgi:hypothetical protein
MSMKAVIVWLMFAVVLGVVAVLVLLMPGATKPTVVAGDKLLSFKPGEVEQIVVSVAGQPMQSVEKAPSAKSILGADAEWQLRIDASRPGEDPLAPWPVESAKLQSLLRVLSEMRAIAIPAAGMELGRPTVVEMRLTGNRTIKLTLAERTLAGTGLVVIDSPQAIGARALVDDQIHAVFTSPGPREWRDPFPFAGIAPDASRIRIEGKGKPLVLAKVEAKWSLREPVQAPGDTAAIQRLLATLGHISVADFLDQGAPSADTGLEKPTGSITVEADRRTMPTGATEPKVTTDTVTLAIGRAADVAVSRLFCSVGGHRVVLINSTTLRDIGADPGMVIWPHPLRESPSDIGAIAFTLTSPIPATTAEKTLKRSEGRWIQAITNNADVPLTTQALRDVEALLVCLTGAAPAASSGNTDNHPPTIPRPAVSIDPPVGYRVLGTIIVGSLAGRPIETLELATADKDLVVLRTGPVYRAYVASQTPELIRAAVQAGTPQAPLPTLPPSTTP